MPQGNPRPGEFYRHFKNRQYQITAIAEHSETGERLVVYQALYGDFRTYVRPYDMFVSEVDHVKYPDVRQKYRFEFLESIGEEEAPPAETAEKPTEEPAEEPDVEKQEEAAEENGPEVPEAADPELIRFMDADGFAEKFEVFTQMKPVMTDKLLDELAVVCDLVIPEGKLEDRYEQMKKCLLTRMKYERERDFGRQNKLF